MFNSKVKVVIPENLTDDNPLKLYAREITNTFDELVNYLRLELPNTKINKLCALLWRLIGQGVVSVVSGPPIPNRIGFAVIGSPDNKQGIPVVIITEDWLPYAKSSRFEALGSIVFLASQIRDWYNSQLSDTTSVDQRCVMYEAELILALQGFEEFDLSEWQTGILEKFPNGLDPSLLYEPLRPFSDAA